MFQSTRPARAATVSCVSQDAVKYTIVYSANHCVFVIHSHHLLTHKYRTSHISNP